mgnify:CR=1 FL=1
MKRLLNLFVPFALIGLGGLSTSAFAAGFDCAKASTLVEKTICSTPKLSALDDQLNANFKSLKDRRIFQLLASQWLQTERNPCMTSECIEAAYSRQIRLMSPATPYIATAETSLRPEVENQTYKLDTQSDWNRLNLAQIPGVNGEESVRQIVAAEVKDGVLHVIAFIGDYSGEGNLYEYSDDHPGVFTITSGEKVIAWRNQSDNDKGDRFAGIIDCTLYYRSGGVGELQKAMAYPLGSRTQPKETSVIFQRYPDILVNARALIREKLDRNADYQLSLSWTAAPGRPHFETVAAPSSIPDGWVIANLIWSKPRPVLYFDNNGSLACIWRADLENKVLTKIVPEHEAVSPYPLEFLGREAIVYLDKNEIKFAIAPDQ